jgi:hypothetical protein
METFKRFLVLILLFTVISCRPDNTVPLKIRELLKDNNITGTGDWKYLSQRSGYNIFRDNFIGKISQEKFVSGPSSLMISRDSILDYESHASWYQNILNPTIPDGSTLRLRAKIRTENIEGEVIMTLHSLFGDDKYENGYYSTYKEVAIDKNSDFKEVVLLLENYQNTYAPTEKLIVGLGLDNNTKGRVYFDDIHLEVIMK